jgi:Protein of unknown function (DUF4199)
MLRIIWTYGAIASLIVGLPMVVLAKVLKGMPPDPWGMVIGFTTMLLAFSTVFIAIKRHRDQTLGGVIRFWPALGLGMGISLVASVGYVLAWEATLALTGVDFAGEYAKAMVKAEEAKGVTGQALVKFSADMEAFKQKYARPLYRMSITLVEIFPVGLLVSLVSAGLLRNSRFLPARRG